MYTYMSESKQSLSLLKSRYLYISMVYNNIFIFYMKCNIVSFLSSITVFTRLCTISVLNKMLFIH